MYEFYHKTQVAYDTLKKYEKMGEFEKATKFVKENQDLLSKRGFADNQRKMVKDFNDHMEQIKKDPNLSAAQKREQIDKVLNAKNQALYHMHKQVKKEKK